MNVNFTLDNVYYAISRELPLNPVAIRPRVYETPDGTKTIEWKDTARGVFFQIASTNVPLTKEALLKAEVIEIVSDRGYHIRLRPLTKEIFEKDVKPSVAGGVDTTSDATIRDHYLCTNFEAY